MSWKQHSFLAFVSILGDDGFGETLNRFVNEEPSSELATKAASEGRANLG